MLNLQKSFLLPISLRGLSNMPKGSVVENIEVVHKGKWLETHHINYVDPHGNKRQWEAMSYVSRPELSGGFDSVCVIAVLKRNLHHNCFVLVKQFRPPLGCYSIEFPAGLCDSDDADVHTTALRELYEETGYSGLIADETAIDLPTSLDPGTENSRIALVNVVIDGDDPKNVNCKQHLDDGEFIEVVLLPVRGLLDRLRKVVAESAEKVVIDSRLYALAMGLEMGIGLSTKKNICENTEADTVTAESAVYSNP